MLIEFSVRNFKSFRSKQTLSMVAAPRLGKKRNVFKPNVPGEDLPNLLKVAAIYGPNASGKSSLVSAINIVCSLLHPSIVDREKLPVNSFRFDPELKDQPSWFEYHFIAEGKRYQFVLAATSERIYEETLTSYQKGKETQLYSRTYNEASGEQYILSKDLEGGVVVHNAWRNLTSPKSLFLSQAVANSSEELNQLRTPFNWFRSSAVCISQDGMSNWGVLSRSMLIHNQKHKDNLKNFLQKVDVPVTDIRFENLHSEAFKVSQPTKFLEHVKATESVKTILTHTTLLGEAEFDFDEESGGTQNLMGFWLPWQLLCNENSTGVVVVDELDSSLHPKIVENLVETHIDSGTCAQLIFTTHDTHLMNTKILRRDQFWITERDAYGATTLFSVHDFQGRDSEDVEKRYYEGRYRGLPILRRS
ncbi:ATP-binding protein [Pseudomonas sp. WS 5411]|uniref:AAA family ATPase n=1 Tax=Pseudomonas sp. WS 5411 TaxID=2717486 RepID=UPI00147417AB|nr:ATP-binding protein [Pseudomonas sp. WS 5411]NMY86093.1 ATP-binding protein [Pseudomonas sp. WS 5411]